MTENRLFPTARSSLVLLALLLLTGLCAADNTFKWYYHSDKVNETTAAIAAALDNNRPLLIFIGKPGCANCELVWSDGKYLQAETKMAEYLAKERIVGLKIEDTTTHFTELCNYKNKYTGIDGIKGKNINSTAPVFIFIKLKSSARGKSKITLNPDKNEVDIFLSGLGNAKSSEKTYAKVTSWLAGIMANSAFKAAFPSENAPNLEATLEFFESDPAFLGTVNNAGVKYDTANGVAKTETAFTSAKRTLYFKFNAVKGRRYVFSVTASSADNAPTLAALYANTAKITAAVHAINSDKSAATTALVKNETTGFAALADGLFFEPTATADYYLCLTADSKLAQNTPFALRYHCIADAATAGTLGKPLWSGIQNGKWSMDYDAAVASKKPFFLYFAALAWCPHCASLEHLVLDTNAFKDATKNIPLVVLDNRRRGETTGPTLLYAASYRSYAGITLADAANKLAANQQIQHELTLPNATRVNYPTILLCQGQADGSVKVFGRTDDAARKEFPVGTNFATHATNLVNNLLALLDDEYEETDNLAATTTAVLDFDDTEETVLPAVIGGVDAVDWRTVNFNMGLKQTFTILADALAANAEVSIGLYKNDDLEIEFNGTGAEPPVLEFTADAGTSWSLKIAVTGQATAVPYTLVCTPDQQNRPYEAFFGETAYFVRAADIANGARLQVLWQQKLGTTEKASLKVLLDGPGTLAQDIYEIGPEAEGVLEIPVTALEAGSETTATLVPQTANCEVKEEGAEAVICVVGAPVFTEFDNGATHELALCQNMEMTEEILPVFNGLTETTDYNLQGTLPEGISLAYQPSGDPNDKGAGFIIVSGTPLKAATAPKVVTVRLKTDNGTLGATLKLSFTVLPLADVNPTAGTVASYTGYLADKNNKGLKGVFTLTRNPASGQLALDLRTIDNPDETIHAAADAWTVDADGTATAEFAVADKTLALALTVEGAASGTYDAQTTVSFAPDMTAEEADEYAGQYNISLESGHDTFKGYGGMVMTVGNDGGVTFNALLPNSVSLPDGACHLVLENGQGVLTLLETNENNTLAGRLAITPKSERSIDDPQPCISGCSVPLAWLLDGTKIANLTPCGTAYDKGKNFTSQLKGHDGTAFDNFALYVIWDDLDEAPEQTPANVMAQLLPAGLVVKEGNSQNNTYPFTYDEDAAYEELELGLRHDANGWWEGSLYGFTQEGRNENAWTFKGVLTPIPASCCGAGPEAVGYGALFVKDGEDHVVSSWPVRLIPDAALPDEYKPATPTFTIEKGEIKFSGIPEGQEDFYAYHKLETDAAGIVGYGRMGTTVDLPQTDAGGFTITLDEADRFEAWDDDNASKGWRCFATPANLLPKGDTAVKDGLLVYTYHDGDASPVQVTDWADLKPGQAFFVFLSKAAVGTDAAIVELDGFETTPEVLPAGQFFFRGYQEGAAEFWKWDKDRYVGPDAADGAGWLKK